MWFIKQSSEFTNMGANCYFYSLRNLMGSERPMCTLLLQQNNHSWQTLVAYIYMDVIILGCSRRLYHFMIIIRILIFRHNLYSCVRLVLQPMDLIMNQKAITNLSIYIYMLYIFICHCILIFKWGLIQLCTCRDFLVGLLCDNRIKCLKFLHLWITEYIRFFNFHRNCDF